MFMGTWAHEHLRDIIGNARLHSPPDSQIIIVLRVRAPRVKVPELAWEELRSTVRVPRVGALRVKVPRVRAPGNGFPIMFLRCCRSQHLRNMIGNMPQDTAHSTTLDCTTRVPNNVPRKLVSPASQEQNREQLDTEY